MQEFTLKKDTIFGAEEKWTQESFEFDKRVVDVFDDMVNRSVPGYSTIQLLVSDLALSFSRDNYIYDLGCSTGNTIDALIRRAGRTIKVIGIDNSEEMVKACRKKYRDMKMDHDHEIIVKEDSITNKTLYTGGRPDVIILNLVLQFIRPLDRKEILVNAYNNLSPGGCLLLVEKTINKDNFINEFFITYYHLYKKEMGYSDLEISKKREALENRLIPFYPEENLALLKDAGFTRTSSFFQWINFMGFMACKD